LRSAVQKKWRILLVDSTIKRRRKKREREVFQSFFLSLFPFFLYFIWVQETIPWDFSSSLLLWQLKLNVGTNILKARNLLIFKE